MYIFQMEVEKESKMHGVSYIQKFDPEYSQL